MPRGKRPKIMRKGYHKKSYVRDRQIITRTTKFGDIIRYPVKRKVIAASYVPKTLIEDVGLPGKSKGKFPKLEENALKQYFPDNIMVYDEDTCIKAGIKARGKEKYKDLSYKFLQLRRFNVNKDPTLNRKAEMCRQFALIGLEPNRSLKDLPTSKKMGTFWTEATITKAKKWN